MWYLFYGSGDEVCMTRCNTRQDASEISKQICGIPFLILTEKEVARKIMDNNNLETINIQT